MYMLGRPQTGVAVPTKVHVECPSCGAHNAMATTQWEDPRTGRVAKDYYGMNTNLALVIIVVSAAASFLVTGFLFGPDSNGLALILTAVLSLGIIAGLTFRNVKLQQNYVHVNHYECLNCGNQWTWQYGTPVPRRDPRAGIREDFEEVFGHPLDEESGVRDKGLGTRGRS